MFFEKPNYQKKKKKKGKIELNRKQNASSLNK